MSVMEKLARFVAAVLEQPLVLLGRAFVPYLVVISVTWTILLLLVLIVTIFVAINGTSP